MRAGRIYRASGARDALSRASDNVRDILAAPLEPFLTAAQSQVLDDLVARAEDALARIEIPI